MTDKWTETELSALRRMIEKAEQDPDFSPADIKALRTMVEAFKGFQFFGRFAKWAIFLLAAFAGAITAWEQVAEKVRQWLAL